MPFPKYIDIQEPLLQEIARRGGSANPADLYEALAAHFSISAQELSQTLESDPRRNKWENMVRWARNDLVKLGQLEKGTRNLWPITESGYARIASASVATQFTSSNLRPGQVYTRKQLAELFGLPAAGAIDVGVFRPNRNKFNSIWLFVTENKTPDRPQLVDKLEGDTLYWQGQPEQRSDDQIINHKAHGVEILLFYRKDRDEHPGAGFTYEGVFEYISHKAGTKPTDFVLAKLDRWLLFAEKDIEALEVEQGYREGQRSTVLTNRFERDPKARAEAIRLFGTRCVACDFSFRETYGTRGEGYIQVHHLRPIATYAEEQVVNPKTDMTVLCANCHAMVHRYPNDPLSLDQLREIVRGGRSAES